MKILSDEEHKKVSSIFQEACMSAAEATKLLFKTIKKTLPKEGLDSPDVVGVSMLRPTISLSLYMQQCGRAGHTFTNEQIEKFSKVVLFDVVFCEKVLNTIAKKTFMTNDEIMDNIINVIRHAPCDLSGVNKMCELALILDDNYIFRVRFFEIIKDLFLEGVTAEQAIYRLRKYIK